MVAGFALGTDQCLSDRADPELESRLLALAAAAYAQRDPELCRLDEIRTLAPDWFQSPAMLGYAAYADRFAGTITGVHEQLPYLKELGVTYLHLMPLLQTREGDSDGGYAVSDYRTVRPDLGTMAELRELTRALRGEGISLVLDLVLNHVAREHAWVTAARAGDQRYRDYFHSYPDRELPDAFERTLPEVFPDFAPGNFTWDDLIGGWVWTTFNEFQWDVNWANPDVFVEYADIVFFLANAGVEVLRLDAIAFLWKRMGTNCQNQPEVHDITQALRALVRIACPGVLFKAEAIVAPNESGALSRPRAPLRQGERSRLSQHPDGADLVDAGNPGRASVRARASGNCRPYPPQPPGSPTCALTMTSVGRSTTGTPLPSDFPVGRTAPFCPISTPAAFPVLSGVGWSFRPTPPLAIGG